MSPLATAALLLSNLTAEALQLVVCCNGGLPFVDLHVWPLDGASFKSLDLTDWVATAKTGIELNRTVHPEVASWLDPMHLPDNLDMAYCDAFNLTFASQTSQDLFSSRNGTLSCRCPRNYYGNICQLHSSPLGSQGQHSFKIFLYLAIIPLFALAAAVTFFLCKQCCCDCFGFHCFFTPCCGDGALDDWRASNDDELEPLDDNTLNRCLQAVKASEEKEARFRFATSDHQRPPSAPQCLDVAQASQSQGADLYLGQARCHSVTPGLFPVSGNNSSPPPAYRPKASPPHGRPHSLDATTQTAVILQD